MTQEPIDKTDPDVDPEEGQVLEEVQTTEIVDNPDGSEFDAGDA